jgi:hypothetical protein
MRQITPVYTCHVAKEFCFWCETGVPGTCSTFVQELWKPVLLIGIFHIFRNSGASIMTLLRRHRINVGFPTNKLCINGCIYPCVLKNESAWILRFNKEPSYFFVYISFEVKIPAVLFKYPQKIESYAQQSKM